MKKRKEKTPEEIVNKFRFLSEEKRIARFRKTYGFVWIDDLLALEKWEKEIWPNGRKRRTREQKERIRKLVEECFTDDMFSDELFENPES